MGRVLNITLTNEQRIELENSYKHGNSHAFRQRCRMILLKSEGRKTKEIVEIVGINSQNRVNSWIKRYKRHYATMGIDVLHNQEGQGRKAIFDTTNEMERIQAVVQQERQKLANAKAILEKELGKTFHIKTLHNFLKSLAADINDLDVG